VKAINEMSNEEIVSWIRALDTVYEVMGKLSTDDTILYDTLVDEIYGRGFDQQGKPCPTLYSERVALGKAVHRLIQSILDALPKWMRGNNENDQ
jgi:hypothetical protein